MKHFTFFMITVLMVYTNIINGQETSKASNNNLYSVFVQSPFFYRDYPGNNDYWIFTTNFEYLLYAGSDFPLSLSLGFGREFRFKDVGIYDLVITSEVNQLFGDGKHFFELGAGLGMASATFMMQFRLGYRLHLGKRLLFRAAYNPYLYFDRSEENPHYRGSHNISVSLGYRFGYSETKREEKKDGLFGSAVHSLQLNSMPLFFNYQYKQGHMEYVSIELPLVQLDNLHFNIAAGVGVRSVRNLYWTDDGIVFLGGLNILYGGGNHYLETGVNFSGRDYYREHNFYFAQPMAGYRLYFGKRFMARLLYSPYFWLSDKEGESLIEKKFVHNFTIGVGVRFY